MKMNGIPLKDCALSVALSVVLAYLVKLRQFGTKNMISLEMDDAECTADYQPGPGHRKVNSGPYQSSSNTRILQQLLENGGYPSISHSV